jgi:ParB family transcriptional regulator, chromosome partitioning protein
MGASPAKILDVAIAKIKVGVQQLREVAEDDSLIELAGDIAARGLMQPVGVTSLAGGEFQLLWGSRRLAAHVRLGRKTILARVMEVPEEEVKSYALAENLQRQQLTFEEEVAGVCYMANVQKRSVEAIAAALTKSRTWVLNRLMVPELAEFLREPLLAGDIKLGHLEVLCKLPSESDQRYLLAQTIQSRWSVGQLKSLASIYEASPSVGETVPIAHAPQSPAPAAVPIEWFCEACGVRGPIQNFRLVRVCNDGCESRRDSDSATQEGGGVDGVASDSPEE